MGSAPETALAAATAATAVSGTGARAAGFTPGTQRWLTALRMTAYAMATAFMIVMVVRGVWLTRNQMEAEANRSAQSAAVLLGGNAGAASDAARMRAVLAAIAPVGLQLRLEPASPQPGGPPPRVVAAIDHDAIWSAALRANLPYVAFVLALGLPTIAIFLYMGWLVNRPALQLLAYAQAGSEEDRPPPNLPRIWDSVLARLQQQRASQAQMQAFLDNAPIGLGFFDPDGRIAMINRYAANFYGKPEDELVGRDAAALAAIHSDSGPMIASLLTNPLKLGETRTLETTLKARSGEPVTFQITAFPVFGARAEANLIGVYFVDVTQQRRAEADLEESRSQLIAFFDNIPTSIYLKKVDHTVVYVSRHLAEQYGKRPEEMIGQQEYDLHIDAMKPHLKWMDAHILSTREAVLLEGSHLQFNRQELVSRFPVFNEKGEITHIGGMNFDIDARAKAQAALEEAKALFEAFILNAPNPMALLDPAGRYEMINNASARYYGETPEALLAKGAKAINARFPEARSVIAPMFARVAATRQYEQVDTLFETPSGEMRAMRFAFFPILGADGTLAFIGNICFDMTDERRAQADLARSRDALHQSEKLAALGSLLAGVSHELNNPLAAVIGQTALLGEDLEGTSHAPRIGKIRRAADRCARIVQSFLAMARQKAPDYRSIAINDQIRAAAELTEYQLRAAHVTLDLRLAEGLPPIAADPDQLHQVIVNLLTNARQALEETGGERRITITTSRQQGAIRLAVADTGKGIDAVTRDRIFDPFFTTKAVGTGTGIGLSYSRGIIEAHGGMITIAEKNEDAGGGTTFVITLPIGSAAASGLVADIALPTATKGRVLIIDDEEDVAETLADMLARMGIEPTVAIGGTAGQAALAEEAAFDLVLSDIRMPDLDGPAIHGWILAHRPDLVGRIAFVTGDTLSGIAADFLEAARCPVLEKPFTPAALRTLVSTMLGV